MKKCRLMSNGADDVFQTPVGEAGVEGVSLNRWGVTISDNELSSFL